ncbi:MAG TPA: four-carbon acid sugar kinase family protein [Methylomirabilota bacterium]|nr:four-carbon acid sugar kinase family protein [Methylomirabilota bacterium]
MKPARARPLTIVADDLTGACDAGTLFAGRAPVPVSVWPRRAAEAAVRVADTESRTVPPDEAAGRVSAVAGRARAGYWFKKIDSTLRGPVGAEVDALLRATGTATALVCPAFPAQGRVVLDRLLLVGGVPVADSPIARDAQFTGGSSSVVEILRAQLDRALAWIPIDQLRAGPEALAARVRRLAGTAIVADAETDADLDALVQAALAVTPMPLLVGSAGLARALAARLGLLAEHAELPSGSRWLIVAGSRHPATRRQIREARAAGLTVLATADRPVENRADVLARLIEQAVAALERERWDLVVVTGGETAAALWAALGAERIDLVGAPAPGLAFGYLRAPGHEALPLLTKAGGFGPPELLVSLARPEVVA